MPFGKMQGKSCQTRGGTGRETLFATLAEDWGDDSTDRNSMGEKPIIILISQLEKMFWNPILTTT